MAANPGKSGMEGYWKMDEASNTTRYDSHRKSNDLVDNETCSALAGILGNSVNFTSADFEFLEIDDNASLSFGDEEMSIGCWIRLDKIDADHAFIGKLDYTNDEEYMLWIDGVSVADDIARFTVSSDGDAGGRTTVAASTFGALSVTTWYFIVGTHNPATNLIGISVNAGTIDTAAHSGGIYEGAADFFVGARQEGGGEDQWLDGRVDEAFLYRKALTAAEITWLYNAGVGRTYEDLLDSGLPVSISPLFYI